ncbi:hypothetical protein IQ260_22260 [Leptolyngbya cf. ectocarpi LEGE 11479]|uniref:Uncharacterized protein n=1 Tax=Leptolyngbya cf. ectocarpi LEGE 11479 TaxID=1828722 RepID=A0A928ZXQ8_LEPEC|nr:hypothetical protein [Leptolyngbya cf. ectocarpi LEGE 11479]
MSAYALGVPAASWGFEETREKGEVRVSVRTLAVRPLGAGSFFVPQPGPVVCASGRRVAPRGACCSTTAGSSLLLDFRGSPA